MSLAVDIAVAGSFPADFVASIAVFPKSLAMALLAKLRDILSALLIDLLLSKPLKGLNMPLPSM